MDLGRGPRLIEVVVQFAQGTRLQDGWRYVTITPVDHERALRHWHDGAHSPEKVPAGHLGHPLVGNDKCNLFFFLLDRANRFQGGTCGEVGQDAIVPAKSSREGFTDPCERVSLIVHPL